MGRGVNKVILIGNLGQDPETRYTANGNPVTNISIATDDSYKDRNSGQMVPVTDWHKVVLFNKIAEIAGQYLRKGSKVYIEGKQKTRKWQDQNGQDRYSTEVVVDINGTMQMLSGANESGHSGGAGRGGGSAGPGGGSYSGGDQGSSSGGMPEPVDDFDDDIPF